MLLEAWGVEARVPFLDHRLVETVVNLPSEWKLRGDDEKHILKESFRNLLPEPVVDRKKKPFPFPVDPGSVLELRARAQDLDPLAMFRTAWAMTALETWHETFGV
jgi:asparagine synthase (glutamine-hydrolysing)